MVAEGLEAYLPLADMVDIGKEVERLNKQASKLQLDFDTSMKRLSSSKVKRSIGVQSLCSYLLLHQSFIFSGHFFEETKMFPRYLRTSETFGESGLSFNLFSQIFSIQRPPKTESK